MAYHHHTEKQKNKVGRVLGEFKRGELKSSSGGKVVKKSQAVAIALSEAGISKKKKRSTSDGYMKA